MLTFTAPLRTTKQLLPGLPCVKSNIRPGRSHRRIMASNCWLSSGVNSLKPGSEHNNLGSTPDAGAPFASESRDEKRLGLEDRALFEDRFASEGKETAS